MDMQDTMHTPKKEKENIFIVRGAPQAEQIIFYVYAHFWFPQISAPHCGYKKS